MSRPIKKTPVRLSLLAALWLLGWSAAFPLVVLERYGKLDPGDRLFLGKSTVEVVRTADWEKWFHPKRLRECLPLLKSQNCTDTIAKARKALAEKSYRVSVHEFGNHRFAETRIYTKSNRPIMVLQWLRSEKWLVYNIYDVIPADPSPYLVDTDGYLQKNSILVPMLKELRILDDLGFGHSVFVSPEYIRDNRPILFVVEIPSLEQKTAELDWLISLPAGQFEKWYAREGKSVAKRHRICRFSVHKIYDYGPVVRVWYNAWGFPRGVDDDSDHIPPNNAYAYLEHTSTAGWVVTKLRDRRNFGDGE